MFLSGCISKQEINAVMFTHERIPAEICDSNPDLYKIGIFRVFYCTPNLVEQGICAPGQKRVRERISYCKAGITSYFGIKDTDLEQIIKKAGIKD